MLEHFDGKAFGMSRQFLFDFQQFIEEVLFFLDGTTVCQRVLHREMTIILRDPLLAEGKAVEEIFVMLGEGVQLLLGEFFIREREVFNPFEMLVFFFILLDIFLEHFF